MIGGIVKILEGPMMNRVNRQNPNTKREELLCIPLFSILEAIEMKHIHFFSLDVEGVELDILKTIPFDKVKVDLFVIEYVVGNEHSIDSESTVKTYREFQEFFQKIGSYKEVQLTFQDVFYARV